MAIRKEPTITRTQMNMVRMFIKEICKHTGYHVEEYTQELKQRLGYKSFANLTVSQADDLIKEIKIDMVFLYGGTI